MKIYEDILAVADKYDTLFIDIYGVLFDGAELYNGTLDTLKRLKDKGKKIVILSNTSQLSDDSKRGYVERGMLHGVHYDYFVTSGEFLHDTLLNKPEVFTKYLGKKFSKVKCFFIGNPKIFEDAGISKVDTYEEADLVYIASPRSHYGAVRVDNLYDENNNRIELEDFVNKNWFELRDNKGRQGLAEFAFQLDKFAKLGKTLLLSNPDIFAPCGIDDGKYPIVMQGAIGSYYEKFYKGNVVYFGKPFVGIFNFAKEISRSQNDKILMIGDTLWTDILGAYNANIDSAMVMTGVCGEFFCQMNGVPIEEKLKTLSNRIGAKLSYNPELLKNPTYLLRHFYHQAVYSH